MAVHGYRFHCGSPRLWPPPAALLLGLLLASMPVAAQTNVDIRIGRFMPPNVEVYFTVSCKGTYVSDLTRQDLRLFEDSLEVTDFTFRCPDTTEHAPSSIALVLDASGSMGGLKRAAMNQATHAFIDDMDSLYDEAAVIWFNQVVTVRQELTSNKTLLRTALDNPPDSGASALWDAMFDGILELIDNSSNQYRAVIALTDGLDNSSTRTPAELISLAARNNIRLLTIGIGPSVNATELELVSLLTGAHFHFATDASEIEDIYREFQAWINQGFRECVLTYNHPCWDGKRHRIELQAGTSCGDTAIDSWEPRFYLDSLTFSDLYMDFGTMEGVADEDVRVPLNLLTPVTQEEIFYPFTFTVRYDTTVARLKTVTAPPGSLLEGMPIQLTPVPGGVRVATTEARRLSGSGRLLDFIFTGSPTADTACSLLQAVNAFFPEGCFRPVIDTARLCILPRSPVMQCDIDMPRTLIWDPTAGDYSPNPFTVTYRSSNTGFEDAKNGVYTITYDPQALRLVSPLADVQAGSPADIAPFTWAEVNWQVSAKPRSVGDTVSICISGSYDNHKTIDCCAKLYIASVVDVEALALPKTPAIEVFPDPVHDAATVRVRVPVGSRGSVWMTDVLGRSRHIATLFGDRSAYELTINLADSAPGLYHLLVRTTQGSAARKFLRR